MAGTLKINAVQLGDSLTATQNFVLQTNVDGTAKLARGNVGATTQDILTVDATGAVTVATAAAGTNTTQIATTAFVTTATNNFVGVPTGAVFHFATVTAPGGYLECNGSLVSRTVYSALFAVIGTLYGVGNGSTTFQLPDLRGEFLRGWDHSRGVDTGRAMGSAQAQDFLSHSHVSSGTSSGTQVLQPGAGSYNIMNSNGTTATSAVGGTETRPRNVAMLPCIKI